MTTQIFAQAPGPFPISYDAARAARISEALAKAESGFMPEGQFKTLLDSAFGNSPFLSRLASREHEFLNRLSNISPECALSVIEADAASASRAEDVDAAMAILRRAKRRAALCIALADIGNIWDVKSVTKALTNFADVCVRSALRFALVQAAIRAGHDERDPEKLEASAGIFVLAMGKYGAFELNYSSDIDLVIFYDAEKFPFRKREDQRGAAVDVVKELVRLIGEITADGYVFRVDLRLRPDAGATQVAISTDAAEAYYEGMGQNWERAAMIKARVCAGDVEAGLQFLKTLEPFVWRKNLDYAAIQDIHSIKRQIHAHEGHGKIAVAGHNIKLGRGGIREIEFFVQTQQLIAGGRNAALRSASTLAALSALQQRGLIAKATEDELAEAYLFLRHLEHRLQMIDDEQTHSIPKTEEEIANVACFAGFANVADFRAVLTQRLQTVAEHYGRLFEHEASLSTGSGSLVFTGVEDDPETLETLTRMGYRDAHHVSAAIRGWHHGRVRAMRSPRARELLTALHPALLEALAKTADPDAAFAQFDRFLSALPGGIQLFSLLRANPHLLRLIAEIAGSAPRLATHLSRTPATLDALMDAGFLGELPSQEWLDSTLAEQLGAAKSYEAALDTVRRFAKEQIFRVGVQIIDGKIGADIAALAFTRVAETVIVKLLSVVEEEFAITSGKVPGGAFAVVAMGKLGGREMTAASDLDLIFVYDAPANVESTIGAKPLPVPLFYARLAQRFISALTTLTAEGGLYEVDMRLRPTGNKGPVAVSLESFMRYHSGEAWTWERMALTRARIVLAPDVLRTNIEAVMQAALTAPNDKSELLKDVREMRERIAQQYPGKNPWDLKYTRGGLVDIEFAAQALQLREQRTPLFDVNTVAALGKLQVAGVLASDDAEALIAAARLQGALMQVLRIALDETLDAATASAGLKALLARAGGCVDFPALESLLLQAQTRAGTVFERLVPPAKVPTA
ncbi:MAG TPA: bifunctional [glutamine synthetase] adenylyltransferase/[glutamine synthetase]-adenylyl-L-tyrosine phosphorylase [Rhizomicrobium sp.]|jgi:glutamate-ammonia-ligase adenylyltransferase|nr:bifunctional [glutamine synthetase] adenylyltransferase/[glutamine synthetase]-adenylyl-L-tyrosine phosphorylase [Rhizomicrobium sp.]